MNKFYKNHDITKYIEFITVCYTKDYSNVNTHKHHILPRFMGGGDDVENIIKLSYNDHYNAHVILAECFPEDLHYYTGNILAANHIKRWLDFPVDLKEHLSKAMRGKSKSKESILKGLQTKIKNGTNKCSDETRLKMSITRKGVNKGEKNPMFGKEFTAEHRKKISESNAGSGNGMYGRKHKAESIEKMSQNRKGLTSGTNNPMYGKEHTNETKQKIAELNSKPVQNIETGEVFKSIKYAAKCYGKTDTYIRTRLKKGIFIYV